jgi:hypothetical protein
MEVNEACTWIVRMRRALNCRQPPGWLRLSRLSESNVLFGACCVTALSLLEFTQPCHMACLVCYFNSYRAPPFAPLFPIDTKTKQNVSGMGFILLCNQRYLSVVFSEVCLLLSNVNLGASSSISTTSTSPLRLSCVTCWVGEHIFRCFSLLETLGSATV